MKFWQATKGLGWKQRTVLRELINAGGALPMSELLARVPRAHDSIRRLWRRGVVIYVFRSSVEPEKWVAARCVAPLDLSLSEDEMAAVVNVVNAEKHVDGMYIIAEPYIRWARENFS